MRNFRKAALAGATAVAVAFGSTAVATAETAPTGEENKAVDNYTAPIRERDAANDAIVDADGKVQGTGSSNIARSFDAVDKDGNLKGADGRSLFGKEKPNFDKQPGWARWGYVLSIFTAVSAVVGLVVGPLYNFVVHGPVNF